MIHLRSMGESNGDGYPMSESMRPRWISTQGGCDGRCHEIHIDPDAVCGAITYHELPAGSY